MDDSKYLNEILNELRKIRQDIYNITREQRELENIKNELKNIEKILDRKL